MYGYIDAYEPLTIENIFLRVSQEDIFSFIMDGEIPDVTQFYSSIVRPDNDPTCYFIWYEGKLIFVDFGNVKTHLDCFGVLAQLENLTFRQSLEVVNEHFKLGLAGTGIVTKPLASVSSILRIILLASHCLPIR